jgi:hypothetical protein
MPCPRPGAGAGLLIPHPSNTLKSQLRAHPFQAELAKTEGEQGKYVTPQAYGQACLRVDREEAARAAEACLEGRGRRDPQRPAGSGRRAGRGHSRRPGVSLAVVRAGDRDLGPSPTGSNPRSRSKSRRSITRALGLSVSEFVRDVANQAAEEVLAGEPVGAS